MRTTLEYYFLLFFVSAVLGWTMEVACKLVEFRRFINRGFLLGPYCPIYGFGAVLVTLLLSRYADSVAAVFVLAMVVCGTLEYLTSYMMEKLFHARWWDYSQKKFNLNGRVCADTLIPFGLLGLGMMPSVLTEQDMRLLIQQYQLHRGGANVNSCFICIHSGSFLYRKFWSFLGLPFMRSTVSR